MSLVRVLGTLETDRLILRHRRVDEAAIYRQLWTERDQRVPPHRRIDAKGRPTVEDIAAQIRAEDDVSGPRILAVERKGTADVIGYCGLTIHGNGSPDEPELAYETSVEVHPYESKYLPLTQAQRDRDQPARVEPVTRRRSQNSRLRSKGHAWRGAGENSA